MNYTPPAVQSIHFVPTDEEEVEIGSRQVQAIYVLAHDTLPDGANHWCFYLKFSKTASICIDMTPTYSAPSTVLQDGSKGHMLISVLPCIHPSPATKTIRLGVCANLTVDRILHLLAQSGRDQYDSKSDVGVGRERLARFRC
ncbi:hypothetical protein VC83_07973 [Pseudogymnoascus destructans]|uniref:DUF7770 domain-containing protein n=2 Tax=Pseudogymnoascus destructans TaxID=655981 RepID=L8FZ47_PSED2|nr:uncharacterized protein VC83_07973 [Pseudogymnoascus destructans]ELR05758.1 hypothetical protein GMDG_07600 [Pseudogymnoascus destructans 20631-21]OAF56013.1 hypothetical protein VC83_07973 [Pseudogymnoascus destructans]